jgi:carboxynorspermidine decarboxylase
MIDISDVKTPCYIIDEDKLEKNLSVLKRVGEFSGAKILLAQKAYSIYQTYPLISKYLSGVASSSLFEARLGREYVNGEVHIFAPAYRADEIDGIIKYADHIVFNSAADWRRYKDRMAVSQKKFECGLRINPEYSEQKTEIYDPCARFSRMGMTADALADEDISGIDGLHFHTMCEQGADVLWRTIRVVDEKFENHLKQVKWLNFGGGHHITKEGYDIDLLVKCIKYMQDKYNLEIYLEPGEAVALNAGYLVTEVLDIMHNGMDIAIVDASAECHMPDVIEMPYRPDIIGSGKAGEYCYTYRLGGPTCLAGDIIGDYSFEKPLKRGDRLVLCDMAIYSMVKNNTFNGINLPDIALYSEKNGIRVIKSFGYEDFKSRL